MGGKRSRICISALHVPTPRQVAEIVGITRANGWVQPKIYQA
jgi:hypothetical protein